MKNFQKIILRNIKRSELIKYVLISFLSGASSFLFLNYLNQTIASLLQNETLDLKRMAAIFAGIIILFVLSKRMLTVGVIKISQKMFLQIRLKVIQQIINSSYQKISKSREQIYSVLTTDINIMTQASMNIIQFVSASVIFIACLIYMTLLSWKLTLITLFTIFIGVAVYRYATKRNIARFIQARQLENDFLAHLEAILFGFKEIFIDPKKQAVVYDKYVNPIATDTCENNTKAYVGFINNLLIGQTLFYSLIAFILIASQQYFNIATTVIVAFVFTLLYVLTSIESIMSLLPSLVRGNISANKIIELENDLKNTNDNNSLKKETRTPSFENISIDQLFFEYEGEEKFTVGPMSMNIDKGDLIFIYGGNGSGKTTFIYALLGLLAFNKGRVLLNDKIISKENHDNYRSLFAVVYSDFYLLKSNYRNQEIDLDKASFYLELFEIDAKVEIKENSFSTTDLSLGQRKRLALVSALLENKPILVLDEWAADQDPHFRHKFYHEIIPYLIEKEQKTVIAITHDDRYFQVAKKLYKMEYGKIQQVDHNKLEQIF